MQREEARRRRKKAGRRRGKKTRDSSKTCALIQKKLEKEKQFEIADDLEDTEENIAHLIEEFHLEGKNLN